MSNPQLELPLATRSRTRTVAESVRAIRLSGCVLTYRLRRSSRRTLALYVDNGGIRAAAPRWLAIAEIETFMREKERWILAKLAESATTKTPSFDWCDGAELRVFGVRRRLVIDRHVEQMTRVDAELRVPARFGMPHLLRGKVLDWLKVHALEQFQTWAALLSARISVPVPQVRLSNAATRWGSCSIGRDGVGSIRLNWRLALLPADLAQYVVAHELAHLREMNHSRRFWAWVAKAYPNYRAAERELRRHGRSIPML
jgi:predicted metal-dependent hydrolase